MGKKYLLVSLEDERLKKFSEIFGNKTSHKIINFLAEAGEASEKDISDKLGIPINTVEYNLKKMADAEIISKSKNFFWSKKGKKIKMYLLSNKSIIISPKSKNVISEIKQIVPVALISGLFALGLKFYFENETQIAESSPAMQKAAEAATASAAAIPANPWIWFLGGVFFVLTLIIIIKAITHFKDIK
ncbi:helix-turn-helix transcriptional regulator [Candidatus Pacearchaeota archaeon]|nr:helix-turn-helix transcriptional regulator [Candidatus Pacearchaeota archaeon]